MIELNGFSDYLLKIETNEVFTFKDGERKKLAPCGDSSVPSWYFSDNGNRVRKSIWALYLENWDKIEAYCRKRVA